MKIDCPVCGANYDLGPEAYGRKVQCVCGQKFLLEAPAPTLNEPVYAAETREVPVSQAQIETEAKATSASAPLDGGQTREVAASDAQLASEAQAPSSGSGRKKKSFKTPSKKSAGSSKVAESADAAVAKKSRSPLSTVLMLAACVGIGWAGYQYLQRTGALEGDGAIAGLLIHGSESVDERDSSSASVGAAGSADLGAGQSQDGVVIVSAPEGNHPRPEAVVDDFIGKHCISCHGPKKSKGQLNFDELDRNIHNNDVAQLWQDVLDVLNVGEMPPEDEPQPTPEELSKVLDSLTGTLLQARKSLTDHGGEFTMRRLNQREYANAIHSIFGFRPHKNNIPADDGVEPFDTIGSEQFFTSAHFDDYLALSRKVTDKAFRSGGKLRHKAKSHRESEERVTNRMRKQVADLDEKMRLKKEGKTWQEMGFKDAGEAQIIFSQFDSRANGPRRYLQQPLVDTGVYLGDVISVNKSVSVNMNSIDPRGEYRVRVRAGVHGNPLEIRRFLRVGTEYGIAGIPRVTATAESPEVIELTYRPYMQEGHLAFKIEENRADIRVLRGYLRKILPRNTPNPKVGEGAALWVDWAEIEGPYYPNERSFFDQLLLPELPKKGKRAKRVWSDDNARAFVEKFAFEAFRRQKPEVAYVDHLMQVYKAERKAGKPFEKAMAEVTAIVLASPSFLYLQQEAPSSEGGDVLNDHEFAVRLAHFLWSSPPDEALYAAADTGALSDPVQLKKEVDRMLLDERAKELSYGFGSQWGMLKRFDAIAIDEDDFPHFNEGIRQSAKREVVEFMHLLIQDNLPVSNLIDSDFAVINPVLAHHYGVPNVTKVGFQKVALSADSPRGGFLAQTAFLATGSTGERTSPVIRGALVMERLLHDPPAPPPPNVPELGASIKKPMSNRKLVEFHQSKPQCASCHKKMDAIGFGLENFDAIGKWRTKEKVGRKEQPIETHGTLPGGTQFADLAGLKGVLLEKKDHLAKGFVESLMAYGMGRTIEFSDADAVESILESTASKGHRVRDFVHEIIASPAFREK